MYSEKQIWVIDTPGADPWWFLTGSILSYYRSYSMYSEKQIWAIDTPEADLWLFLRGSILSHYRSYSMYSEKQIWANSVTPVHTSQNAAPNQGIHCLLLIQQFYSHS